MADILIYGKLKNQTTDNIIAGSDQLYDNSLQKFQSEINQDLQDSIQSSQATIGNYTINGKKISENPILNKTDVGLGNVINEEQIPLSQKGIAGGVATLDENGKLTGTQLPVDEEDITVESGNLKLKDRAYDEASFSGKGYKILRKNIVEGKNILTQEMINNPNTVYEIRYDFDLNSSKIIIPEGCVLKFVGGLIKNGSLEGNTTIINSNNRCFEQIIFSGTFCGASHLKWFLKKETKRSYYSQDTYKGFTKNKDSSYYYDASSDIENALLLAHCSGGAWFEHRLLDCDNLICHVEKSITITYDNSCDIKNMRAFFSPSQDFSYLFVFDKNSSNLAAYTVSVFDSYFAGLYDNNYQHCGVFWAKYLDNTTDWRFENITVYGFTGYFFVNQVYLQEGAFVNIHLKAVGGFITYNNDKVYGETRGQSNMLTFDRITLDIGINTTTDVNTLSKVIQLLNCGQVTFTQSVFQGVANGKNSACSIENSGNNSIYPNVLFNQVWFEFVYTAVDNLKVNRIDLENKGVTIRVSNQNIYPIYVNCDNCIVNLDNIQLLSIEDPLNYIIVKDEVTKCSISYNGGTLLPATPLDKTLDYVRRGFINQIDNKVVSAFTLSTQNNFTICNSNKDNMLARIFWAGLQNDTIDSAPTQFLKFVNYNYSVKFKTIDNCDVLEFDCSQLDYFAPSWSGCFAYPANFLFLESDKNIDKSKFVNIIYRYKLMEGHSDGTEGHVTIKVCGSTIIDADINNSEWSEWTRGIAVGVPQDKEYVSFNFKNAILQIAYLSVNHNTGYIDNNIVIYKELNRLLRNSSYVTQTYNIPFTLSKITTTPKLLNLLIDCTSVQYLIEGALYKSDGTKLINIQTGNPANVLTSGTFSQKPTSSQGIKVGFKYFCTDKQTTEGQTNGIMIYYKGDDTWVDANGVVVDDNYPPSNWALIE